MILDTTLREGLQMFGVRMTAKERRDLAIGLADLGVEEIEAGWIGLAGLGEFLDWSGPLLNNSWVSVWSRCHTKDVLLAADHHVTRINLGVPGSDAHRNKRLSMSRPELLEHMRATVRLARMHGMDVSVGLEDASRADTDWLIELAMAAQAAGAFRVRISDTVGVYTPLTIFQIVSGFRSQLDVDIAVHCHNDFGMGTANAVTALQAGADWADASLLGMGERSGLAATEELAAYLSLQSKDRDYETRLLPDLCARAARLADLPLPRNKPVIGSDIFACETGIHLHGMQRDPGLFEPYAPENVANSRKVKLGDKSGRQKWRS